MFWQIAAGSVAANGGATFGNPVGLDGVGRNTAWHFSGMWIFVLNGLAVDVVHPQRERFANS
jgi:hypothetical protein